MPSPAYRELLDHARTTFLLTSAQAVLSWDQETGMPRGGGELRSRQLAMLATLAHERTTDRRVGDWILACEGDPALLRDADVDANVSGWRRDYDRATRLPGSLVHELAGHESRAQQAWAEARQRSDFASFRPLLQRMLELQRHKADCLRRSDQQRWDALADLHEPGMTAAGLRQLFGPLRRRLVDLRHRLERLGRRPDTAFHAQRLPLADQEACVRTVLAAMGFDFDRGRLDRSAHPFCTGSAGDVRLTTRYRETDFLDALGSTMHEGGHGLYEQGLPQERAGTPLGEAVSLGIHESQSRLWENHVGRSRGFWQWAQPVLRRHLGPALDGFDADTLWRTANSVEPGLIRVEADEVTYDLHVMVRFELETAMLEDSLPLADLPAEWQRLYGDYLGVVVPDDGRGCLQDVHWSCGLFGYFPTYTLGNLYAAQFAAAACAELGDVDVQFARGDFAPLRQWLLRQIHCHGRRHEPAELCRRATGEPLSSEPLLQHLERRLGAVYGLC